MRTLELPVGASPKKWGQIHGETYRGEIQSLAQIRLYLTVKVGQLDTAEQVLEVAARHVAVLEKFDPALAQELLGIAAGANVSPAQIVVLNHYTDLRDIGADHVMAASDEGCSVVYAKTARVLAQTWDMHATSIPFTMMLRVPDQQGVPGAWLLSLTGCLGMAGLNRKGLAIAINNLHSKDAKVGVVWSALVRRVLQLETAKAARDLILTSPVGSGHHYLVADAQHAFGVETSGELREVVYQGDAESFVHTNHCVLESVAARNRVPEASTTYDRYDLLAKSVRERPIANVTDAWQRLGSHQGYPRSICTNMSTPENPHAPATCAGLAIDLGRKQMLAAGGFTHNVEPETYCFEDGL